uniref:UBA domain-containing protein n=3 Tax=Stomoxys calcitrans TaxID=35570 RepID=A0A1I8Q4T0_STOCA
MLNELITWVLNTYLGKYLEDFNPAQLSIALVSGEVELENVPIRRDALRSFGIPVEALAGSIGKIKLQIPVRQFRTSPWIIAIEKVYGVFGPKDLSSWDSEKEKDAEFAYKTSVLDAKEANWRVDNGRHSESYYSLSYSNWINYGASLATNIIENLELKIKDIHLRYEDTVNMHVAGIRVSSISAQSCDAKWTPGAKNPDLHRVSYKLLELKDFYFYWDNLDTNNTCKELSSKDLLVKMNDICKIEDHKFLTNSINASVKFKRERCKQSLRSKHRPRISCEVSLDQVKLVLNDVQYIEIMQCISSLQRISEIRSFKVSRPTMSVLSDAKQWWKYAAQCYGFTYHTVEEKWAMARENIRYIYIYKRLLINPSENMSKEDKQFKINFEKNRSLDDLKFLRDICFNYISHRGINSTTRSVLQGKNILYHWFPNWLGWYGISENVASETGMDNNETYKHIEDDILSALKESIENETFSKRDAVFGNFRFALSDVKISLVSSKSGIDATMLDMNLKNLFCFVEIKPKLTSYRVGISLGSIHLNDKMTESTEFPFLVKPQKKENTNHKSLYNEFLNFFSKKISDNESDEPWFQLQYERNPPEHKSDYRLIIKSKSLDIVYNETAFKWLASFFIQPLTDLKTVRNQLVERKSRLKFFKNWKSVLVGQKKESRKKWSFEIDISAPRIICVDNFKEKNTSIVLIDFGRFQLFKNERSTEEMRMDVEANENDSDEELFMTPCSTPPGSHTSKSVSPDTNIANSTAGNDTFLSRFVINSDTGLENELHSEIYDKYIINLTDMQVLVCKNKEIGYACAKSSSNYHLLDKFNINLHLERRIISTSDPDYPAFTLFGNLNRIVAHINEQKISDCIRILNPLTLELSGTTKYSKIDERNYEDNNDRFEDSDTTIFQFVIGQIILEIQSRQKSIAEMQVIGAKTGITKKTGDVNINMSVHGFLLVDAIQSFGPDFELLVASHRHVEMDSISGSLKQSEPCSPTSPGSPDPNAYQRCASPQIINKALNELQAGMESDSKVGDALITIDFHVIHDPGDLEATQIANITFNNLDVIANQETVVELLGFGKRIVDNFKHLKSVTKTNNQAFDYFSNTEQVEIRQKKYEISFDFHRLNILVLRSIRIEKNNTGRKVGTLTMSEAKIHATLGKDVSVSGVLGGIQIIDITPEGFNHQRIFSVGKDPLTDQPSLQAKCVLHSLANEMYGNDFEQRDCFHMNALTFKINKAESSEVEVKIRMASVWYTHCPRFIEEIYLCVKEFRQYFKNFVKSLRSKASHMAKGLVHHISGHKETVSRFAELSLDVVFSSPVLVLPKSCESTEVLVANLGKITVRNKQEKSSSDAANIRKENECMWNERITYFIDVRNINLFSLHAPKRKVGDSKFCQRANEMYSCQKDAIPILHDTALLFQCVYEFNDSTKGSGEIGNALVVDGSVTQNLQVSLSRRQYEQLMECLNYATNVSLTKEACPTTKVDDTLPGNKNVNDSPKPFYFEMIDTQFSVPILRLDLRNEHNMSLICLTLKEFSFKNKILHNKQKETQILLRSVLMEDLKCPLTSKFRNMVNSSSDILAPSNSFKNHISSSCPDLSRSYNQGNSNIHGSTPSNLDTLLKNRSTTKANDIHDLKDIEGLHFLRNRTTGNLVIYRSLIREKKHSSIDFNCLNLIISIEKWFMVFDFFGLISNQSDRETETSKQSPDNKICELSHELHVTIRSLDLILVRNDFELAKANVSNVQVHISRDDFLQTVRGSLGSISIYDLTSYGHLYQEKFSTSGMEALSFKYSRKNDNSMQSKKQSRSLEKDALLAIDMSSVKYVHTKRFVIELQLFVKELLQLQSPVMNHIKSADEKNRNSNFQKIGLEVHADSPIILFPVSHNSNHLLIADLGKFSLKNIFAYYNHTLSEERQSTDTSFHEIIDVMNIDLLNINLLTGKREINNLACTPGEDSGILHVGNFCIVNLGKTIFKEKCHLKIHVIRNTEPDVSHNIPDIKIKGTLSELNGLINVQQYKLIRGFLKYNLGETIDDVYFNYQMNLNESLEILSSITKVNVPQAVDVWNTLSINFILDNVTIYLAEPCELQGYGGYGSSGANLACIKFIKSNLKIDLYSDGSQDIDLISSEILLMDARESSRKSTPNNCFKHILKPSTGGGSTKSTVQAEIHSRSRGDVSKYTILLNNMRIMALLDYLESLKNFLNEEPLMSSLVIEKKSASRHGATQSQQPFATTFTEDTDVKNEFVLNITNSEIVFVENSAQSDSNAIILKSTTVFSYKPNSSVVPV